MFRKRARSGFAPSSVRRLLDLPFQVSRFLAGDAVLVRVDARLTLDSIAAARVERNDSVLVGLVLRPLGGQSSETRVVRRLTVQEDSIDFAVEAAVPPGEYLLSAEAVEGGSRLAWRTRFRLEADVAHDGTISLSDPVIAHAYRGRPLPEGRSSPTLQPHGSLVIPTGATVGVYAEASGLRPGTGGLLRYRVHVEVDRSDEPSLPVRVVQWLGRAVGLVGEEHRAVLAWDAAAAPGSGPVPVAFDLDLAGLDPGLHAVTVQITDPVSGASATSSRLVRIAEP